MEKSCLNNAVRFAKSITLIACLVGSLTAGSTGAQTFSNPAAITIPSTVGGGTPYPSNIAVSGLSGVLINVNVTLTGISHTFPSDIGALLVTPGGQRIRLFTEAGNNFAISGVNLTLSANATSNLPGNAMLVTGTYLPTQATGAGGGAHPTNFPAPAPAGPYSLDLTTLNGDATTQNGSWSLYVDDDSSADSGAIAGGWSVAITTTQLPVAVPGAPTGAAATAGNAQATLTFAAPVSDGGLTITGYTATCSPGAFIARGAVSPLIVTGLTNGTAYSCSVAAKNALGTGAASTTVSITPMAIVPGAPVIGTAVAVGNANALLAFTAPVSNGGSVITDYTATCNPGAISGSGPSSPVAVMGLSNGITYACSVTATNAVGTGAASANVNVMPFVPVGPFAYITNTGNNNVSVIDTVTNTVVARIPAGFAPYAVAVNPGASRVYVTNTNSNDVSVINTATNSVVATVPVGAVLGGIAVNSAGTRVWVTNQSSNSVSVIDTATNTVIATVPVGTTPGGIAVNPSGTRVYVANQASNNVSVIDTSTNAVVATLTGLGTTPGGIALNAAGTRLYVGNFGSSSVSVIDTASNTVLATITVGASPIGIAVNPAGTRVYVANRAGNSVSVIDTSANSVIATVAVGTFPQGLAINVAGTRIYAANRTSNNVSVIDTSTNSVIATVPVGNFPNAFGVFIGGPVLATVPGAPTILGATPGMGQATISFTAPAANGGSPITTYAATCNPGALTMSGSASPLTVTGLVADGTNYTCTVAAINSAGTGAPSSSATVMLARNSVTLSAGPNGVLSPIGTVLVAPNGIVNFSAQPNAGYQANVGGTCPITGGTPQFSAGPITANCAVLVTFTPVASVGFSAGASSFEGRARHTATLLNDGRVLVAGGMSIFSTSLSSAERYDRASNSWSAAGNMQIARSGHTATLLSDGRVLIVGGEFGEFGGGSPAPLLSVEIYNPASNSWAIAATLPAPRGGHSAVRLQDGSVLVSGGGPTSLSRYDPALNSWSDLPTAAVTGMAILLNSGKVLLIDTASARLFDPATNALSNAGAMPTARDEFAASVLMDGRVLVVGGRVSLSSTSIVEIYDPVANTWSTAAPMSVPRLGTSISLLANGLVLVAGGSNNSGTLSSAEVYDPAGNQWRNAGSLSAARLDHTATRLTNGAVLIYGGSAAAFSFLSSSELYNGVAASAPGAPRNVTALPGNGQVTLTFDPPLSNGGAPVTSYTATCSSLGRPDAINTGPGTSIVVSGLVNFVGYTCLVVATNLAGNGPTSASVSVVAVDAPVIISATTAMGTVGQAFQYAIISATAATSYAVTGSLPAGVSLNTTSGVISGTPTQSGTFNLMLAATNGAGTGTAMLTITVAGQFIALNEVVSRKIHGTQGPFDIAINPATPISGAIDIEPRAIGVGHLLIFRFDNGISGLGDITARDAAMQDVGIILSTAIVGQTTVQVTLANVPDNKRVTVRVNGVNGVTNASASIGFLLGDADGSGAVGANDVSGVKARSGQIVNNERFRYDLNASGTVTAADIAAAKRRSGTVLAQ